VELGDAILEGLAYYNFEYLFLKFCITLLLVTF